MDEARRTEALNACRDLKAFLDALRELLQGCIEERPELLGRSAADLRLAWIEAQPRFQAVSRALERQDAAGRSLSAQRKARLDRELVEHGLTGDELALKLGLFRRLVREFLDELAAQDQAVDYWRTWIVRLRGSSRLERFLASQVVRRVESLLRASPRFARGRLKRVLDAADVVLGSLGQALSFLPGVGAAVGGIAEIKDALKVIVDEPAEAERPPRGASSTPNEPQESRLGKLRWLPF
jgi:hypothetical protein